MFRFLLLLIAFYILWKIIKIFFRGKRKYKYSINDNISKKDPFPHINETDYEDITNQSSSESDQNKSN